MGTRIYNLEFPALIDHLTLSGYSFRRVPEYRERIRSLHHAVGHFREFDVPGNFGGHAITAEVDPPDPQPQALLKWGKTSATHLDDVLLILSLFTMRHVWAEEEEGGVIIADHRTYQYGWALRRGLPFVERRLGRKRIDAGFESGINKVLILMAQKAWQTQYRGGHYLFLANHAFRRQILETTFSLCWTIWEHLFALHNDEWMDRQSIHHLSGKEKIAYVMSRYGLRGHLNVLDSPSLKDLATTRNKLIHFGMFETEVSEKKAATFVKWTEYLIAKTLGLYEVEAFDSVEEFEAAANERGTPQPGEDQDSFQEANQ